MDLSKYAALFLAESREHLASCNQLLLEWEREPSAGRQVGGLFRAIHTIKGMSATMGYAGVADLAHRLENLLDALRQGSVTPAPAVFQLLFRSVDALATSVEGAVVGAEPPADEKLAADLDAAAAGVASRAALEVPRSADGAPDARADGRIAAEDARVRPVQVALRRDAVMRGARAALVVRRAESLGMVSALRPAFAQFDNHDFDGRFSFRLASVASDQQVLA